MSTPNPAQSAPAAPQGDESGFAHVLNGEIASQAPPPANDAPVQAVATNEADQGDTPEGAALLLMIQDEAGGASADIKTDVGAGDGNATAEETSAEAETETETVADAGTNPASALGDTDETAPAQPGKTTPEHHPGETGDKKPQETAQDPTATRAPALPPGAMPAMPAPGANPAANASQTEMAANADTAADGTVPQAQTRTPAETGAAQGPPTDGSQPDGGTDTAPSAGGFDAALNAPDGATANGTSGHGTSGHGSATQTPGTQTTAAPPTPSDAAATIAPTPPSLPVADGTKVAGVASVAAKMHLAAADHGDDTVSRLDTLSLTIAAKSEEGARHFDIRLDPPELGRVEVRLSLDDSGKAHMVLCADKSQTLSLLQRDANQLVQTMQQSGIDVSGSGLSFSLRNGQNGKGGNREDGGGRVQRLKPLASIETASSAASLRLGADTVRLDIKV